MPRRASAVARRPGSSGGLRAPTPEDATSAAIRELRRIPGVGPRVARDLLLLGIREPDDLRGRDPERLYQELCRKLGAHVDRCMLYTLRCAVYFAEHEAHDPELLKWWNWKDR